MVEIESDAQEVVKLKKGPHIGRYEITGIIQEVKKLGALFTSFTITYTIARDVNVVVHQCASRATAYC
jgi:hypothetical protein